MESRRINHRGNCAPNIYSLFSKEPYTFDITTVIQDELNTRVHSQGFYFLVGREMGSWMKNEALFLKLIFHVVLFRICLSTDLLSVGHSEVLSVHVGHF